MIISNKNYIIYCNCPDLAIAKSIALELVTSKLAACINIFPAIESIYLWDNKIKQESEVLLLIKTKQNKLKLLINKIKEIHPYECPEIIYTEITGGNKEYLKWLNSCI